MKFLATLSLFAGLTAAVATTSRPYTITADEATILEFNVPAVPEGAPADFHITTATLTRGKVANAARGLKNRRSSSSVSRDVLQKTKTARGPITALDFYECSTSGNPPVSNDCNIVVSNVFAADLLLSVGAGSCLLFQYNTCWGFFCSLCQRLGTDTNFIGAQLTTAQDLCVSGGAAGTVVGEDSPQWEAGFIRANGALPNYAGEFC